jgi:hypothetical protein
MRMRVISFFMGYLSSLSLLLDIYTWLRSILVTLHESRYRSKSSFIDSPSRISYLLSFCTFSVGTAMFYDHEQTIQGIISLSSQLRENETRT